MTKYLLIVGTLIFLLGFGINLFSEWFSTGYIISRIGMIVFAVGMFIHMIRAFRKDKD